MKDVRTQKLIQKEEKRQAKEINLIASENIVSPDVLKALGSCLGNKYAEGYPSRRYYKGNSVIDEIEELAQERALSLFGQNSKRFAANVQPLSGSPANLAVYTALVPLGQKIMCLELSHGGHLSHGHKVSLTGQLWQQTTFGVNKKTEKLDYEEIKKIAKKERPAMIVAGFTAYPRKISFKKFREIADEAGALLHVDMSHIAGLVAGGAHPSPFAYADVVMTTTHKTLRGPRGAIIFSKVDDRKLSEKIDKAVFPGVQGGPHINQIGALSVALFEAKRLGFRKYIEQVLENAKVLARELTSHNFRLVSGGTDNHLILIDVWRDGKGISGKEAADRLEKEGIIVNQNTIPYDTRTPFNPSGIRLGTAFETTKGAREKDMKNIARRIATVLQK